MAAGERELDRLAIALGRELKQRQLRLVTAESCTGGWVAQAVTSVAGSSGWFERGFVTYSNESKQELLGVRPETLAKRGAVDEETAREMARGALDASRADIALAVTGIAGPDGGTADKPVGTVCFAWVNREGLAQSETRRFSGDRKSVRLQSAIRALEQVLELLAGPRAQRG